MKKNTPNDDPYSSSYDSFSPNTYSDPHSYTYSDTHSYTNNHTSEDPYSILSEKTESLQKEEFREEERQSGNTFGEEVNKLTSLRRSEEGEIVILSLQTDKSLFSLTSFLASSSSSSSSSSSTQSLVSVGYVFELFGCLNCLGVEEEVELSQVEGGKTFGKNSFHQPLPPNLYLFHYSNSSSPPPTISSSPPPTISSSPSSYSTTPLLNKCGGGILVVEKKLNDSEEYSFLLPPPPPSSSSTPTLSTHLYGGRMKRGGFRKDFERQFYSPFLLSLNNFYSSSSPSILPPLSFKKSFPSFKKDPKFIFLLSLRHFELQQSSSSIHSPSSSPSLMKKGVSFYFRKPSVFHYIEECVDKNECYFCSSQTTSNNSFLCSKHQNNQLLELYVKASKEREREERMEENYQLEVELGGEEENNELGEKEKRELGWEVKGMRLQVSKKRVKEMQEFKSKAKFKYLPDHTNIESEKKLVPALKQFLKQLYTK